MKENKIKDKQSFLRKLFIQETKRKAILLKKFTPFFLSMILHIALGKTFQISIAVGCRILHLSNIENEIAIMRCDIELVKYMKI